jgi:hypothetical protein
MRCPLPILSLIGALVASPCSVSTLPLIEPDMQISRIRLSDEIQAFAHEKVFVSPGNHSNPSFLCMYVVEGG